jgi:L-fuconolactonase
MEHKPTSLSPVIDSHIHLYDPTRPGGIPWPEKDDSVLYQPALPARYGSIAEPFGVLGAIAIECSPLASDNDWLLQTAESTKIIVGVIGNLDPALPGFPAELERLRVNQLFRGIRYGNLWGRSLGARLKELSFVANLKLLARSGLLLESANPNPTLVAELLQLTALVPDLRIVIDHLPQALPPIDKTSHNQYLGNLKALSNRATLFVKGSEILRRVDGAVPKDLVSYRTWLDQLWEIFGEDRMLFGSDWPNSDHLASFADTFNIARHYISARGKEATEKYLWKNSIAVYGWKPRSATQAELASHFNKHIDERQHCPSLML